MKKSGDYELSFHSDRYAQKNLEGLYLSHIPLSVPVLGETVLMNSSAVREKRRILIETIEPGSQFEIRRTDGEPLQVMEVGIGPEAPVYGPELFKEPIQHLALTCLNHYAWSTNVDEANINDTRMMHEFVGILSGYASTKQWRVGVY